MQLGFTKNVLRNSSLTLVGHVPIELSRPVAGCIKNEFSFCSSLWEKKCEVGLNFPGLYQARMKKSKFGNILAKEIKKITKRYHYFDFRLEQDIISEPALKKKDTVTPKPNDMTRIIIAISLLYLLDMLTSLY